MAIKTPAILPGEPGWEEIHAKTKEQREQAKKAKKGVKKAPLQIGNIVPGDKGFRIGRGTQNVKGDKKYPVWRYKRKIGTITVLSPNTNHETMTLVFQRLGGIGNHKHLIQDADFQLRWLTREQELLMTQKECYLCKKKLSKSAQPNLYHYKLFKKRTKLLEDAEKVPSRVVSGELTISQGWETFNNVIEEGNRYYMGLQDTALICATCAHKKGLR